MSAKHILAAALLAFAAGCEARSPPSNDAATVTNASIGAQANLTLTRLDCGTPLIKNFDKFFSDRPGLYEAAPREITDSCYLIQHGDEQMVWDTGFPTALKGKSQDMGDLVVRQDKTLAEQLAQLGLEPADIDVVGISHMHQDHTGQAAEMPQAHLIIGKGDFEQTRGKDDPFGSWRKEGANVTLATSDVDIFRDGSVVALHLPGHTPNHLALLVKLASGPVLLSGDIYHSRDAREKRGVPPFNTSREQTLRSMDRVEKLAKEIGAKVVIQHEPRDIALLPAFPRTAQ